MNLRKLALFSSVCSICAAAGTVPMLGLAVSLYVSLTIWATIGFAWWLASLPVVAVATVESLLTTTIQVQGLVSLIGASAPTLREVSPGFLTMEAGILLSYPAILWFAQRGIKRMLVKRLGESRMRF